MSLDASGIKPLISGVRAGVTAGGIASEILESMDVLSTRQASIETRNTWLNERGSQKAASAHLQLHPNAVAYRINRASEALGTDYTDPDSRLARQLACWVALANHR